MARAKNSNGGRRAAAAQVEVIEEVQSGPTLETGLVLTTTLLLVGAIVLIAMVYNSRYGG